MRNSAKGHIIRKVENQCSREKGGEDSSSLLRNMQGSQEYRSSFLSD